MGNTRLDWNIAWQKGVVRQKTLREAASKAGMLLLTEVDNLAAGGGLLPPGTKQVGYLTV